MDRQLKRVGLVLAALFGVVMAWGIVRAARDRDWPTTGDTVGCWTSGPWRVQLTESSLTSGSMRFRTSGIQRVKDHSLIEAAPFEIVDNRLRSKRPTTQPAWIDIQASGRTVEHIRLVDVNAQSTPWLARC
jgi:hypothetical protein